MPIAGSPLLEVTSGREQLRLEAWGQDSIRARVAHGPIADDLPGALVTPRPSPSAGAGQQGGILINGKLTAQVSPEGLVSFCRTDSGLELFS